MDFKELSRRVPFWYVFSLIRNQIDFRLRNRIAWKRPLPALESSGLPTDVLMALANQEKAVELCSAYPLEAVLGSLTPEERSINLYYLDVLNQAFSNLEVQWPDPIQAVDVGPSDWFYLPALHQFLAFFQAPGGRKIQLDGFEMDPYRVYADFHSRYDHAQRMCSAFPSAVYHPYAYQSAESSPDLVIQFFPFLFLKDHLAWGLPRHLFEPYALFQRLANSLKPGGYWLILNQGIKEHQMQKEMAAESDLTLCKTFQMQSTFKQYSHAHWVMVLRK